MQNGRRTFLATALGGLAGVAGLLLPSRLLACHRRQVCSGMPMPMPAPQRSPYPLVFSNAPFRDDGYQSISFPDEKYVKGGGGLFAWGWNDGDHPVSVISCVAGSSNVGTLSPMEPPEAGQQGEQCTWACRIDGLTPGVAVTLNIYYADLSTMPPTNVLGATTSFTPQASDEKRKKK
jgi:hypothetical protein